MSIEQEYFKTREQAYNEQTNKQTRTMVQTRRIQNIGGHKPQYVIGVPMSIVRALNLKVFDTMKITLDNDTVCMKKVDLTQ